MKYYIAYRFTGEDSKELNTTLKYICNLLANQGHNYYCSFFDPGMVNIRNKNILAKAFNEIDNADNLLVFIKSEHKSEGMLMEIGYALANNKKITLLIKKDVSTAFIREIADKIIEFEELNNLKELNL